MLSFVRKKWSAECFAHERRVAHVREQTMACVEVVHVSQPHQPHGPRLRYGFIADTWQRTVTLLRDTAIPVTLVFPHRKAWSFVSEDDVRELRVRLQTDVLLRLRLLDVMAATYPGVASGQEQLRAVLASHTWPRWRAEVARVTTPRLCAHGDVEAFFALLSLPYPDKRSYFYAWCVEFLVRSVATHTFQPLLVENVTPAGDALVDWLLAFYDENWECEPAAALAAISSAWEIPVQSVAQLHALLPPTSCPTYDAFAACCDSIGTLESTSPQPA